MQHLSGTSLDPFMADAQRRYGGPLGSGGPPPGHMPGVYQSTNLTVELMQRERERLERMGLLIHFGGILNQTSLLSMG